MCPGQSPSTRHTSMISYDYLSSKDWYRDHCEPTDGEYKKAPDHSPPLQLHAHSVFCLLKSLSSWLTQLCFLIVLSALQFPQLVVTVKGLSFQKSTTQLLNLKVLTDCSYERDLGIIVVTKDVVCCLRITY